MHLDRWSLTHDTSVSVETLDLYCFREVTLADKQVLTHF